MSADIILLRRDDYTVSGHAQTSDQVSFHACKTVTFAPLFAIRLENRLGDSAPVQEIGAHEQEEVPRCAFIAFYAGDGSREKVNQVAIRCACQRL